MKKNMHDWFCCVLMNPLFLMCEFLFDQHSSCANPYQPRHVAYFVKPHSKPNWIKLLLHMELHNAN